MEELRGKGYECFSKSRRNGIDLTNQNAISEVFKEIIPDVIINCAAHVGGIHYLSEHSAEVLDDNLRMMLNLYQAVQKVCPEVKVINPISNCSYPGRLIFIEKKNGGMALFINLFGHLQTPNGCFRSFQNVILCNTDWRVLIFLCQMHMVQEIIQILTELML